MRGLFARGDTPAWETLFRDRDVWAGLMWDTMPGFTRSHGGAFDAQVEGIKTSHEGRGNAQGAVHGKLQFRWYLGVEEKLKTHKRTYPKSHTKPTAVET